MRRKVKLKNFLWGEEGDGRAFTSINSKHHYTIIPDRRRGWRAVWCNSTLAVGPLEYCMFACVLHEDCEEERMFQEDMNARPLGIHG